MKELSLQSLTQIKLSISTDALWMKLSNVTVQFRQQLASYYPCGLGKNVTWPRLVSSAKQHQEPGGVGGGGVLDQYLGMGEPLRVWNPDHV